MVLYSFCRLGSLQPPEAGNPFSAVAYTGEMGFPGGKKPVNDQVTCLTTPRATLVLGPPHLNRLCAGLKLIFFEAIEMQEEVYPVFEVIESAALMLLLC